MSARIAGLTWSRSDFCAGWLITGAPGTGKTAFLEDLLKQLFRHESGRRPNGAGALLRPFGGLVLEGEEASASTLVGMARRYGRRGDLKILTTRPVGAREDWIPSVTFNLLSEDRIPAVAYAEAMLLQADPEGDETTDGGETLRALAAYHLARAIELLRALRKGQMAAGVRPDRCVFPALDLIGKILTNRLAWEEWLASVGLATEARESEEESRSSAEARGPKESYSETPYDSPELRLTLLHFRETYWGPAGADRLTRVQRLLRETLGSFLHADMAKVFCRGNSFEFSDLDRGALVLLAMPRPFRDERRVVAALLKQGWSEHVLHRFEGRRTQATSRRNLVVFFHDDAPEFVSQPEPTVDHMSGADAAIVIVCRTRPFLADGSHRPPSYFLNRMIFRSATLACATESAKVIGKRVLLRVAFQGLLPALRAEVKDAIDPDQFLALGPGRGVLVQRSGRWKPIDLPVRPAATRAHPWLFFFERWLQRFARRRRRLFPGRRSTLSRLSS